MKRVIEELLELKSGEILSATKIFQRTEEEIFQLRGALTEAFQKALLVNNTGFMG